MATDTTPAPVSIGPYRNIQLWPEPNKHGYYEIRWTEKRGKRYCGGQSRSTGQKDFQAARAEFAQFVADIRNTIAASSPAPIANVEILIDRWLDDAEVKGKHPRLRYILAPARRALGSYTPAQLAAGGAALLDAHIASRPVASATRRRELSALMTVIRWAAKKGLVDRADIPVIDVLPLTGAPRKKYLTAPQAKDFWNQAMVWPNHPHHHGDPNKIRAGRRVRLFIAIAMKTAARREAIFDLTWDRVDLVRGTIDFNVPGRIIKKNKRRPDDMPIAQDLWPILEAARRAARKDAAGAATGPVLDPVGFQAFGRSFSLFAASAGVPWVTPHVLRHTWASLAVMAGVSLSQVADIMADSVKTVTDHYAHLSPGHRRAAVDFDVTGPVLRVVGE